MKAPGVTEILRARRPRWRRAARHRADDARGRDLLDHVREPRLRRTQAAGEPGLSAGAHGAGPHAGAHALRAHRRRSPGAHGMARAAGGDAARPARGHREAAGRRLLRRRHDPRQPRRLAQRARAGLSATGGDGAPGARGPTAHPLPGPDQRLRPALARRPARVARRRPGRARRPRPAPALRLGNRVGAGTASELEPGWPAVRTVAPAPVSTCTTSQAFSIGTCTGRRRGGVSRRGAHGTRNEANRALPR
jgi:hypothetical protein